MVALLAQATRVPPPPPLMPYLLVQIPLLGLLPQNLRLLRETRHVREARRPAARTHAHEALLRFPVQSLRADVARLPLRVLRAFLGRDRDGLSILLIRIILFCATGSLNRLADLVMTALFPMCFLAFRPAVACTAAAAFLAQGQPKLGSAGGAFREDHRTASLLGFGQPRRRRRVPPSS